MHGISYWIDKRAMITPNRTALVGEGETLTYLGMSRRMNTFANALANRYDVKKGDRVGILSKNNPDFIITLFAAAKLNAIVVPLNIRLTAEELEYQVNDSGLKTLICDEDLFTVGKELKERTVIDNLITFKDLRIPESSETFMYEPDAEAPYIICYTSGTTGKPKGAVLTQSNMFWNAINNTTAIDITSQDRIITLLPLFHIGGIGLFTLPVLLAGGMAVVPEKFDPEEAISLIERHDVSIVMGVPTIHDAIRKAKSFQKAEFKSVRWFYSGGAPCTEELIQSYLDRGINFGQGYGLTETSPTVFMMVHEDHTRKIGSIGKPALFTDIRIVDNEGVNVKPGEIGELLVKGPNVMMEYWKQPEATDKSFIDGWFATGDLVSEDEEGFIYVAGRKKEMIISGGENIYPLEVEKVIIEHPAIEEAAVVGAPHEKWGETPVAFISFKAGMEAAEEELRAYCLHRLARYKVPSSFKNVSALPKNATGKIDKKALSNSLKSQGAIQ